MSASKLTDLSLAEARDGLRQKDFTSEELTQAHISAMEAGRKLNAVILETPEKLWKWPKLPTLNFLMRKAAR